MQIANHKRCEMLSVSTECLTCVAENNVKNVFRECNMVRNFDFDPFLTLSGIVIPRFQKIYETNLLTQERKILEIQNPNPLLSILVKTPFSLSIEMNDKTFSFGPTGNKRDILYSGISKEELEKFLDFWFYLKKFTRDNNSNRTWTCNYFIIRCNCIDSKNQTKEKTTFRNTQPRRQNTHY